MAAKGSKRGRGRAKSPAKPDTEVQPGAAPREELPSDVEPEPQSAASDERSPEAEPETESLTSPEAPSSAVEGEGESPREEWQAGAEDRPPAHEPEEAGAAAEPGQPEGRPPRGDSYRLSAGLAVILVVAGLIGAWFYGTVSVSDPERLDQHTQRLNELAEQAEAQAGRLGAAEEAVAGLRSEVGQVSTTVSRLQTSLNDLQATAEANRRNLDDMAAAIEALRRAVTVPTDDGAAGEVVGDLLASIESLDERVTGLEAGEEVGELQAAMATLDERVTGLEASEEVGELQAAMATLDERLARLEGGEHLAEITASIARVQEEISELRELAVGRVEQDEAATELSRAYAALADRVGAGAPFVDELEAVAAQLPGAPGLEVLRPHAGEGVPTIPDLQARLGEIAAGLSRLEPDEVEADDGIWQTLRERLEGMVRVRRTDEPDWSAVMGRAEEALQRGDIETAIAEVEQLRDAAPGDIEPWLADAKTRRDAEAGLDELSAAVLRQFAGRR
jgi:predicted  nucleic acid-binding Zn-ribbon protein